MEQKTIEEALRVHASHLCVLGAVGAGKTELIVQKAHALIERGDDPSSICVFVNDPAGIASMRVRLQQRDARLSGVRVSTVQQEALLILDAPDARSWSGRVPVVATRAELSLVRADVAAHGLEGSSCQIDGESSTNGASEEGAVDVSSDVLRSLHEYGRLHPAEAVGLAFDYLDKGAEEDVACFRYDAVFVDDVQNLSDLFRKFAKALCRGLFVMVGDAGASSVVSDTTVGLYGANRSSEQHPTVCVFELKPEQRSNGRILRFAQAVLSEDSRQFDLRAEKEGSFQNDGHIALIKWPTPELEVANAAKLVSSFTSEDETLLGRDIYIAVPNRVWARAVCRTLSEAGIDSTVALDEDPVSAVGRSDDARETLEAFGRLGLFAGGDAMAWRVWCGVGRKGLAARPWAEFRAWAEGHGWRIVEAMSHIRELADDAFVGASELKMRAVSGTVLVQGPALCGFSLARACNPTENDTFAQMMGAITPDLTAGDLYARVRENCLSQAFEPDAGLVRVGSLRKLCGQVPRIVIVLGAVEGFMPQTKCFEANGDAQGFLDALGVERCVFGNALGKAAERLVVSTFQKTTERMARGLALDIKRCKMERGVRMAMLARTRFVDDAGDAAPGTVGGEQFLLQLRRLSGRALFL